MKYTIDENGVRVYNSEIDITENDNQTEFPPPMASDTVLGGVYVKSYDSSNVGYITIDNTGFLRYILPNNEEYILPIASMGTLGGVMALPLDNSGNIQPVMVDNNGQLFYNQADLSTIDINDIDTSDLTIDTEHVLYNGEDLTTFLDVISQFELSNTWNYQGIVSSEELLPSEDNTPYDYYLVGTSSPYSIYFFSGMKWEFIGSEFELPSDVIFTTVTADVGTFSNIYDMSDIDNLLATYPTIDSIPSYLTEYVTTEYLESNYPTRSEVVDLVNGGGGGGDALPVSVNGVGYDSDVVHNISISAYNIPRFDILDSDNTTLGEYLDDLKIDIGDNVVEMLGVFDDEINLPILANTGDIAYVGDVLYIWNGKEWDKYSKDTPFESVVGGGDMLGSFECVISKIIGNPATIPQYSEANSSGDLWEYDSTNDIFTALKDIPTIDIEVYSKNQINYGTNYIYLYVNGEKVSETSLGSSTSWHTDTGSIEGINEGDTFYFRFYNSYSTSSGSGCSVGTTISLNSQISDPIMSIYNTGESIFDFNFDAGYSNEVDTWTNLTFTFNNADKWNSNVGGYYGSATGSYIELANDFSDKARYLTCWGKMDVLAENYTDTFVRIVAIPPDYIGDIYSDQLIGGIVLSSNEISVGTFRNTIMVSGRLASTYGDVTRDGWRIMIQAKSSVYETIEDTSQLEISIIDIKKR